MRILISGSGGFVGSALLAGLNRDHHQVLRLVRSNPKNSSEIFWNPSTGELSSQAIEGLDAVIHLGGESIAEGRWTETKKERILSSRVQSTRLLSETLAKLSRPPKVFITASAIGFYGDRGDETLKEESAPGSLFLSHVCREWEKAAEPVAQKGIRVVNLRFGVILGKGGALAKMILPFKLGLGGIIGNGQQWMSWISLEDAAGSAIHALHHPEIKGAVNVVSPNPIINFGFTKTLGKLLGRPTTFPLPAFAARLVMGQMADELLLASARVEPAVLNKTGYVFKHPTLESALKSSSII